MTSPSTSLPAANEPGTLPWLYEPQWAGGWQLARMMFALCCVLNLGRRFWAIGDAIAAPDMVFTTGYYRLADYVTWSEPTAYGIWTLGMVAAVVTFFPTRAYKPALVIYSLCLAALALEEALNVAAYDRLLGWMTIGFLLSPAAEASLTTKWRSPLARYWMLLVFISIYGSTGFMKLIHDPGWFDGSVLAWHLVHQFHANNALAAWVSGQNWLLAPMCWATLVFEVGFPLFVMLRRTNPWILLLGAAFHLGLLALMNVGPFGLISMSAYPVLLHPEIARDLWTRLQTEWAKRSAR